MSMQDPRDMAEEQEYLRGAVALLRRLAERGETAVTSGRRRLYRLREDQDEEIASRPADFERNADISQYFEEDFRELSGIRQGMERLEHYRQMIRSPYFGRFDFAERGSGREKIYIGRHTLMDEESGDIYVYDWRAPICAVYYQYGLGPASYESPDGPVGGEMFLKRQYRIEDSRLRYFFDSGVVVDDDILQDVLGHPASPAMRSIVETIAREQDRIIRDTGSDLLMVEGPAGSGKTVIALHRVAWLLYRGAQQGLTSRDIVAVTPSDVFSRYISGVLPELGETNISEQTFDDLAEPLLGRPAEPQEEFMEALAGADGIRRAGHDFKNSGTFRILLDRWLTDFGRRQLPFADVWYDGRMVAAAEELRGAFLRDAAGLPPAARLARLEASIFDRIHPLARRKRRRLEQWLRGREEHAYDYRTVARWLTIREAGRVRRRIARFTRIDPLEVYRGLFADGRLRQLAKGMERRFDKGSMRRFDEDTTRRFDEDTTLPPELDEIVRLTARRLRGGRIPYEDAAPLLYLRLRLEGKSGYEKIRQVVVDEAQEYTPMQYAVFGCLFPRALFTLLGDTGQTVLGGAFPPFYETAEAQLHKKRAVHLSLEKSYRSTWEITRFAGRLLSRTTEPFERHGEEPRVVGFRDDGAMEEALVHCLAEYKEQGMETAAVLCRTESQARELAGRLADRMEIRYVGGEDRIRKGCMVMPVSRARGLEFDAVCVYDASAARYRTPLDRQLLYIAATRALHRLSLFYKGEPAAGLTDAAAEDMPDHQTKTDG